MYIRSQPGPKIEIMVIEEAFMRRFFLVLVLAAGTAMLGSIGMAQQASIPGPYKLLRIAKVGGTGGFDYVYADPAGRRLYIARSGPTGRITVFNLDTLAPVGEVPNASGHGVAVDPKVNHGFLTSKPMVMFDTKTLAVIKTIDVQGDPDGILFDPYNERIYDFSHKAPHVTVIDGKDGSVVGTIDLGGMPEQGVSDGKGHLYIDVEDKERIAVVDVKTLAVTNTFDLTGKGGTCAGLALDIKNRVLFATCRNPKAMVILNADDGNIITIFPIGTLSDGAVFNPKTMEAFSSQVDGTLTVVKEKSPTDFELEQTVQTLPSARTLTLDTKTGRIFLIAAQFGPPLATPPPGTPPGRNARGELIPNTFSILEVGK
jgi:DNA-binding beta-propeller fold protein YncE